MKSFGGLSLAVLALSMALPAHASAPPSAPAATRSEGWDAMQALFRQWRAFARPDPAAAGALDYAAAALAERDRRLRQFVERLEAVDRNGLSVRQRNDWKVFRAELDGMRFELDSLRPWQRDPGYYAVVWATRTDVPLREGPTPPLEIQLYRYRYPLGADDQAELRRQLALIPGFYRKARDYLTGNAGDLWRFGIQGLRDQRQALADLLAGRLHTSDIDTTAVASLHGGDPALVEAAEQALRSTDALIDWLQREAPGRTGPSGVGKEAYTWSQQHVHLLPYTWEQEVALLERELARARASLLLEQQRNRDLPPLRPAGDQAQMAALFQARLQHFLGFLFDRRVLSRRDYIAPVLASKQPQFVAEAQRRFFDRINLRDPSPLLAHDFHWIELARDRAGSIGDVFRDTPLLYNVYDTRAEGFATAFEELLLHAGLYDDQPRSRELVWIMLANRAARGLASLYVQANQMDLETAGHFHADNTPLGWAVAGDELTAFEQLLYLRQPGYGTSYVTGKILLDQVIDHSGRTAACRGEAFRLDRFMDWFQRQGIIPMALILDEVPGCGKAAP